MKYIKIYYLNDLNNAIIYNMYNMYNMLLCDMGPVYIKCGLLISDQLQKDEAMEELKKYQSELTFFETSLTMQFGDKTLLFFKINFFKIDEFKQSFDYKIVKNILERNNNSSTKMCNDNSTNISTGTGSTSGKIISENNSNLICYCCWHLNEQNERLIFELFGLKCIKVGHANQLSIYGLDYVAENTLNSFFELPGQSINNLVQVGHELQSVTEKNYLSLKDSLYPFLFANISEGVSIYRVDAIDKFTRIGGTSFGATTYWSLVSLTCGYNDPELAVKEAIKGNNELIDLSVGDIYGGSYEQFGLNSQLIASSFGKLKYVDDIQTVDKKSISRSLLTLLCVTISQITALTAKTSNVNKVIVLGNPFNCLEFMQMVQMGTNYFSGETVKAIFSDYAPYINLIGMCKQIEMEKSYFN
jgi:pantothenate kinase